MIGFLTIIMYLSTLAITIIPFIRDIVNPITKKFTKWGIFLISISCAGMIANYYKDKITSEEDKAALSQRDKEHKQDEIKLQKDYTQSLVENSRKNLSTYIDVLAKYNLEYVEGQNKVVQLLRDSSNKPLNDPYINICKPPLCTPIVFETKGDTLNNYIKLSNTGTLALNININVIMCFRYNDTLFTEKNWDFHVVNASLNTNEFKTLHLGVKKNENTEKIDVIYYCINGSYTNTDNKVYKIKEIYKYEYPAKLFVGIPFRDEYNEVISFLKVHKL